MKTRDIDTHMKIYSARPYLYSLFEEKDAYRGVEITKSGEGYFDLGPDLFEALYHGKPGKLACFLGFEKEKKAHWLPIFGKHTLVSGMTQKGKTTWLNVTIASLGHFHHPEYLKICVLEGKGGSLKLWKKVTDYTVFDVEKLTEKIIQLGAILDERKKKIGEMTTLTNAREVNAWAYRSRKKNAVWPQIVVIFDEFQCYVEKLKDKEKWGEERVERDLGDDHPISIIHNLAAQGAGRGAACHYAR